MKPQKYWLFLLGCAAFFVVFFGVFAAYGEGIEYLNPLGEGCYNRCYILHDNHLIEVLCPEQEKKEKDCRWQYKQIGESGITNHLKNGWEPTPLIYHEGWCYNFRGIEGSKQVFWLRRRICK